MKSINPTSARALTWLAAMIMVVGFLVLSPSGAFFIFFISAVLAAFPAIFGSGKTRLAAAILLLASIGFSASKFPDFKREQEKYHERPEKGRPETKN